eukprot:TRINITY_DN15259_c0_g1_i1.p1 TRINITY_DN15259_c0_g1~~TRINITY_DN15259_c0_g1_i1.p1  ORF type:complete len:278 (-),score=63.14 TRINITY_DN15259_c0_g1_i1:43-876(-)
MASILSASNFQHYWNNPNLQFAVQSSEFPLVSPTVIAGAIGTYLAVIFGLQYWMTDRKRYELKGVVAVHNFFLSALSLAMALGLGYEGFRTFNGNSSPLDQIACDPEEKLTHGRVITWFYIFFLSKYYELLDTVIIVLKKRPLIFLHVYHHCITIVLVYVMLYNMVGVQWLCITANAFVHIPMYTYYALTSLGYEVWFKKYITKLQITQFVIGVAGITYGIVVQLTGRKCSGNVPAWFFGLAVMGSFLYLFAAFYKSTYKTARANAAAAKANIPKAQ